MNARDLPSLSELSAGSGSGGDLLATSSRQRWTAMARPGLGILAYAALAGAGWWWLTPIAMFAVFVAVVTVTHDVVHRSIGLGRRATDWALFVFGLVLLESGHAYRATHLQHHRLFPSDDDPEGYPAHLSFAGAVVYGPVFLVRLWGWAFRRAAGDRRQRAWLLAEAAGPAVVVALGFVLWPVTPWVLAYAAMAIVGSWVYPLLTVYLPHHDFGETPLTQTRTLRGRVIPAIFLELTYHLEHHLYPQVPSHRLAELAGRLDPVLAENGVRPVKVL
jgi:fatty acid desaturase